MNLASILPENPRARAAIVWGGVWVVLFLFVQFVLPALGDVDSIPPAILFRSLVFGLVASMLSCGLVLIYRMSRVINFAQLAIGSTGAQLTFLFVRYTPQVPFIVSLLVGIALAAGLGAIFDVVFGRRFANSPRLVMTVVTITGAIFLGEQAARATNGLPFFPPLDSRDPSDMFRSLRPYLPFSGFEFTVGDSPLQFGFAELMAIELALLSLLGLFLFFRYTRSGVAVRAVAENVERASLLGISVGMLSTIVWAISGALGGAAAVSLGSLGQPSQVFGFSTVALLAPLAGAVVVRFASLPKATVATVAIVFVVESARFALTDDAGLTDVGLFLVILVGLLLQRRAGMFRTEQAVTSSWSAVEEQRPIPKELSGIRSILVTRIVLLALLIGALVALPFLVDTGVVTLAATVATYAIVAVSLVVLTGWGGQVSLGQFAFVAVGSVVEAALAVKVGVPFWFAVPMSAAITGLFAAAVGLPALRARGLMLAVATFAFSVAVVAVLFEPRYFGWLLVTDRVPRPTLFFLDFDNERNMYYLCVAAFLLAVLMVVNLRRSRVGRLLIALRDNDANVQSFGVALVRTKLLAFSISGALAGFAGAILVHQLRTLTSTSFSPDASFNIFVYTVIGGVSSVVGALLGAAFPLVTGYFIGNNPVLRFVVGFVPLLILFSAPGGIIGLLISVRDSVLRIIAQRRQIVVPSLFADFDATAMARRLIPLAEPLPSSGLAALPLNDRFTMRSELYQGHGERILGAIEQADEEPTERAALASSAAKAAELEDADENVPAGVGRGATP